MLERTGIRRVVRYSGAGFVTVILVLAALVITGWSSRFHASVRFPNGFVAGRSFDFTLDGRDDLFAKDGVTLLARNVEFTCFNDRYVEIYMRDGYTGLYDGNTGAKVPGVLHREVLAASGLKMKGRTCNGYLTGMTGTSLLYDGNEWPFLPPCEWRNMDNPDLLHREWFRRPCDDRAMAFFGADRE